MVDLWHVWDERLHERGDPARLAGLLTDSELLNLLACDEPRRQAEKRILRQEAFQRLHRVEALARALSSQAPPTPEVSLEQPWEGPRPGPLQDPF